MRVVMMSHGSFSPRSVGILKKIARTTKYCGVCSILRQFLLTQNGKILEGLIYSKTFQYTSS